MTSPDNRWTLLAAAVQAASSVVHAVTDAKKRPDHEPALHERVALLEKRVEDLEEK